MALRKAAAYTKRYARPFTRKSKNRRKNYIKTVPPQKIVKFNMGNSKAYKSGKYNFVLKIMSGEKVQVRDNALEASRQSIQRYLDKKIPGQYFLAVRVFPHHILRENKVLTGAGADRMQSGMKHSYGKTMGRAAMIKSGKEIILLAVGNLKHLQLAREAVKRTKSKLPFKVHVETVYK